MQSFKQKLNLAIHKAARVVIYCESMREQMELARIKAKSSAYIENNPQARAVFLVG